MVAVSGRGWRLAPCLVDLVDEADDRAPHRSHAADGSIGNAEHAARESDHNPDDGWVCAVDIDDDHDSADLGVDLLFAHLVASKDPRVKYLIRNGTIWKSYENRGLPAWTPQVYTGPNRHDHHGHVSVHNTPAARNNTAPWWPQEDDDMPLNDADKAWIKGLIDAQNKWIRSELGTGTEASEKSLFGRVRKNVDTARDSIVNLIRGG